MVRMWILLLGVARGFMAPRGGRAGSADGTRVPLEVRQAQSTEAQAINDAVERRYQIIAGPACEAMALALERSDPNRFRYHPTKWGKFPDGTDEIVVGGFAPHNLVSGEHVVMLCSFHDNDVTLSQFQVMIMLLQYFIESLTIVLPFYPTGTMERVVTEGEVATANTYAQLFSCLPSCGRPTRLVVYDLHTLQNRFYLHGNCIASLQTTVPQLLPVLTRAQVDCVAFPDDGAAKRFKHMFDPAQFTIIVCGKTGGTLFECGVALRALGAASVSAFVAHAVFPKNAYERFMRGGDRDVFEAFYVTNSIPTTTSKLPKGDVFEVIDIMPQIVNDLDWS